jgi:hypothetical protein
MTRVPPTAAPAAVPVRVPKTSGLAIASLICGIGGLCTLGLGGLVGIILGIIGLVKIGKSGGQLKGKGLAIGGIVASALSMILGLLLGLFCSIILRNDIEGWTAETWQKARDDTRSNQGDSLGRP